MFIILFVRPIITNYVAFANYGGVVVLSKVAAVFFTNYAIVVIIMKVVFEI